MCPVQLGIMRGLDDWDNGLTCFACVPVGLYSLQIHGECKIWNCGMQGLFLADMDVVTATR